MLNITIISVGKCKEKFLLEAVREYEKRLKAYIKLDLVEVDEVKLPENPSQILIAKAMSEEASKVIAKIQKDAFVIPMCIEGNIISSDELAKKIGALSVDGTSKICFIIGGSNGLSDDVKKLAGFKLSMSKMTFPHHLARVMLLEQVYRAFNILAGGKYHK